jgi:hypothetical protein
MYWDYKNANKQSTYLRQTYLEPTNYTPFSTAWCIASCTTTVNSVSFINIPTTSNQSYIFTYILRPSAVNSLFYTRPSSNSVNVNSVSIPLYGLQNVSLPSSYTYIVQSISIIYNIYASTPQFFALTSVSAY